MKKERRLYFLNALNIILNIALSFLLVVGIMPKAISYFRKLKFGQVEREEGLESHKSKGGTTTMGGIVFILCSILTIYALNFSFITNPYINLITFSFLSYGLIGFLDDYLIIVKKTNDGLSPKQKYGLQSIVAILFFILAKFFIPDFSSVITIPLINFELDLMWIYPVFVYFMFTATTNAVNLTDGLDGLATGLSIFAIVPFAVFAIINKNYEVATYCFVIIAALFGFLCFNKHPAKIFMGDTGSLALGGLLSSLAILTKQELLLIIIGGVFLTETLSVILQVIYFKLTHGKRLFKMSPIHHHFELCGWSEKKVVTIFWATGLILAVAGIMFGIL
jgi:phospho-N-acetylmuramoyl-pentapeptide-transferase